MTCSGSSHVSPERSRRISPALLLCSTVALSVLFVLTGAVDRESAPIEVELTELRTSTFRQLIEKSGVVEPLQSAAVHSDCYWSTTILSIVPEGTMVKKGDVVCVLDSADIQEYAKTRELLLVKYRARLNNALKDQKLLKTDNERRLDAARFVFQKAHRELGEYQNGTFPQQVEKMEQNLAMLAQQVGFASEDMRHAERMWAMGMVSQQQMNKDLLSLHKAQHKYDQLESELALVNGMSNRRQTLKLEHDTNNARRNVARTHLSNGLAVTKNLLTTLSYQRTLRIYERYYQRAIDSIEACTLRAPRDGQVVHANSWYLLSRGITMIETGSKVRNRQKVFEIPDPNRLKVSVPIIESLIGQVHVGMAATVIPVGYEDVEIAGKIIHVSRYPRQRSSYTPGLKDYWLDVELLPSDDQREYLSPKSDVTVRMTVQESDNELQIPRSSVIGIAGCNFVYVFDGYELVPREVDLGAANDEFVCVKSGLEEGDQLVTEMLPQHEETLFEKVTKDLLRLN